MVDAALKLAYLWKSPYTISREFLSQEGIGDLHVYGETPKNVIDAILDRFPIKSHETFLDLGSGVGKVAFYVHRKVGCAVLGVDHIPTFVYRADWIASILKLERIAFQCRDFLQLEYQGFDWIYLAGTCLSDEVLGALMRRFETLSPLTRVISVSYPLSDYSPIFEVKDRLEVEFEWGKTDVYLNVKTSRGLS